MDRINEVTKDCFNALIQIRSVEDDPRLVPDVLHQRMRAFIDASIQRARQLGFAERDVADIAYAIVALTDEVAMRKTGKVREYWMQRPLQLQYFNENVAGEGFFVRLQALFSEPGRLDVLRVYHACLLFGFQGKFGARGGEVELSQIERRASEMLARALPLEGLSRRHLPPKERRIQASRGMTTLWIGLFTLLFALCFLIVLRVALENRSEKLVETTRSLIPQSP